MWLGTRLPFLQISGGERGTKQGTTTEDVTQSKVTKATGQKTKDPELEYDKSQTAMGSRNGEVKIQNTTLIVSQIQSWIQNQMRESSITMNMVMRHSYKNEENISESVKLIFAKTSFLKTNLPVTFSRYK